MIVVDFVQFRSNNSLSLHAQSQAPHYLACVIHSGQPDKTSLIDLGEVKTIDTLIGEFRSAITGENNSFSVEKLKNRDISFVSDTNDSNMSLTTLTEEFKSGVELRKRLFDPIGRMLGVTKKIFFSPDGNLTQLPLEVLPVDDKTRLIDLYLISYLSTGRDILRFNTNSSQDSRQSIVIADPNFDYAEEVKTNESVSDFEYSRGSRSIDLSGISLNRLEGTKQEGEVIAGILGSEFWFGDNAVKERMFHYIRSPRVLHIATHGLFMSNYSQNEKKTNKNNVVKANTFQENPLLRSCLALAGANCMSKGLTPKQDAGNGLLTAEEASSLNLSATELVVLSACDTGRGDTFVGEGVFGLRRVFAISGADTLIMSLWKVPDEQTKELMVDFYARVLIGVDRVEALRSAQLEIRRHYPHPYFWGAFTCQGNPSPIRMSR